MDYIMFIQSSVSNCRHQHHCCSCLLICDGQSPTTYSTCYITALNTASWLPCRADRYCTAVAISWLTASWRHYREFPVRVRQ